MNKLTSTNIHPTSIPTLGGVPNQAVPLVLPELLIRLQGKRSESVGEPASRQKRANNQKKAPLWGDSASDQRAVPCASQQTSTGTNIHIHVTLNDRRADELMATLPFFTHAELIYFPAWDVLPYDRTSPNPVIVTERLEALVSLMKPAGNPRIVITTASAFSQLLPPKEVLEKHSWNLAVGDSLNREALSQWLVQHGYMANSKAVESGEFAMRGSIIDIIPPGSEIGFRLDLFGDDIESMKQFDPLSQRSDQPVDTLQLLPASEILLTPEHIERFRSAYRDAFGAISHADPFYETISSGSRYVGMEHWLPLFYERLDTLADYAEAASLSMDDGVMAALEERAELIAEAYQARMEASRIKTYGQDIYHPVSPEKIYLTSQPERLFGYNSHVQFSPFEKKLADGEASYSTPHLSFTSEKQNPFEKLKSLLTSDVYKSKRILLTCYSIGSRERLVEMVANHGMQAERVESFQAFEKLPLGALAVAYLPISAGVESDNLLLITEEQLLGERLIRTRKKKRDADYFMAEAANFEEGELVVHKEHGIGRFVALETIDAAGAKHDCLKLLYADDDRLFVPVENIDVISRYGSDSDGVELDRLGGVHWQARKAKMKERIGAIAAELMKTAAERALKPGEVMQAEQGGYQEFAARFGHTETEDQERSIEQVEADLLSGKPMDRLICGDVGFGKTEVALRAAYIAVKSPPLPLGEEDFSASMASAKKSGEGLLSYDGGPHPGPLPKGEGVSQVAIIVPTTLLARQHFQNFSARFAGFDVRVRQLSRMVSAKEAKAVKEGLADGSVDIVIGTHALLAKEIKFKNLGLVIVDEEQRFGVAQKEKLKALKSDVHVLTLTATPIPRTLQLSLSGVRDLSLITTPPVDRLAVRTFVMPFDPVVLREALMREKNRSGGSFIVTPRISDIGELKANIQALVPELHIEVAHGQMPAADLDELMNRFYDRKIDVLISTTIIESGLDVPHANTMIIHRADRFGLAQLYQLRGRVGRSKTRAYAYLLLPKGGQMTRDATKRLEVMQTLDRLGAGFTLASHDMDIRGFGNLVGDEQSGHIREVGVELYQQMLMEEIEKRKEEKPSPLGRGLGEGSLDNPDISNALTPALSQGEREILVPPQDEISPQINLGLSVLIPEHYVDDLSLRMGLYRRIAAASSEAELESLAAEMIDRFGPLPEEVGTLFTTMRLKRMCQRLRITKLDVGPKGMVLHFAELDETRAGKLIQFLAKHPTKMKLRPDQSIFVSETFKDAGEKVEKVRKLLEGMMGKIVDSGSRAS